MNPDLIKKYKILLWRFNKTQNSDCDDLTKKPLLKINITWVWNKHGTKYQKQQETCAKK